MLSKTINLCSEVDWSIVSRVISKYEIIFLENSSIKINNSHETEPCSFIYKISFMIPMELIIFFFEANIESVFSVAIFWNNTQAKSDIEIIYQSVWIYSSEQIEVPSFIRSQTMIILNFNIISWFYFCVKWPMTR